MSLLTLFNFIWTWAIVDVLDIDRILTYLLIIVINCILIPLFKALIDKLKIKLKNKDINIDKELDKAKDKLDDLKIKEQTKKED